MACSSSLPPRLNVTAFTPHDKPGGTISHSRNESLSGVFTTRCCRRPICPTCLQTNPRLARYNPCLHCLGGADVLNSGDRVLSRSSLPSRAGQQDTMNLDGGLNHEDVFTLGDDEDDDEDGETERSHGLSESHTLSTTRDVPDRGPEGPTSSGIGGDLMTSSSGQHTSADTEQRASRDSPSLPFLYRIQPVDTLLGIALRCKVDVSLLSCNVVHRN